MNSKLKTERLIWLGLGLTLALLSVAILLLAFKLQSGPGNRLPVYGPVADFTLTNQNGRAVSLADLRGHVWVADIIFTRCAGPCLKMSRQMSQLQQALPDSSRAKLITLTTDPEFDTPAVLKTYGQRFHADPSRWLFLTGTKAQIARVAADSLKFSAVAISPADRQSPADLFIHSTIFVVVDKRAQLRGIFETTGDDVNAEETRAQILAAIQRLEREG